ncbi:enoyl-CoA hydratase/isomerase family protein [Variovorax dokdonensis]|uniref:Enoyl-CoA hydratase/isomerase family protein n=1 Tax=Variovorax dokdonensis TaxID=344883 RepID=A0ABT7NAZ8_9BURK|nr:enoyl-CoA hydratase/isomerase family protein [Variovorax dokdonensis]MDM0045035.1 enoyl-CoA hydratase/isomerase family protein [Variovorax dokdonensis]
MSEAESGPVFSRPSAHVALIELNRPQSANRLEPQDLEVLRSHIDECESSADVRVLVLAGRGNYFSAGFDLRALADGLRSGVRFDGADSAFEAVANRLDSSKLISIAALNGPVLGGATDLALACDFRMGSSEVFMQMPAAKFGLPLYAGALQRYVSRMGLNHAKRLVFMAERVGAQEMLDMGFLTALVRPSEVMAMALSQAAHLATMPPKNMAALKQVLNASALGEGTAVSQREVLARAFDPEAILQNIAASQAARRKG